MANGVQDVRGRFPDLSEKASDLPDQYARLVTVAILICAMSRCILLLGKWRAQIAPATGVTRIDRCQRAPWHQGRHPRPVDHLAGARYRRSPQSSITLIRRTRELFTSS